jgi:hypothetical protein
MNDLNTVDQKHREDRYTVKLWRGDQKVLYWWTCCSSEGISSFPVSLVWHPIVLLFAQRTLTYVTSMHVSLGITVCGDSDNVRNAPREVTSASESWQVPRHINLYVKLPTNALYVIIVCLLSPCAACAACATHAAFPLYITANIPTSKLKNFNANKACLDLTRVWNTRELLL